jgi:hypothetical protein
MCGHYQNDPPNSIEGNFVEPRAHCQIAKPDATPLENLYTKEATHTIALRGSVKRAKEVNWVPGAADDYMTKRYTMEADRDSASDLP